MTECSCGEEFESEVHLGLHLMNKKGVELGPADGMNRVLVCPCGWESNPVALGHVTAFSRELERLAQHSREQGFRCEQNARCQRALSEL